MATDAEIRALGRQLADEMADKALAEEWATTPRTTALGALYQVLDLADRADADLTTVALVRRIREGGELEDRLYQAALDQARRFHLVRPGPPHFTPTWWGREMLGYLSLLPRRAVQ